MGMRAAELSRSSACDIHTDTTPDPGRKQLLPENLNMKQITKYAKGHRKNPTKAELELKRKLLNWKIRFRSQRQFDYYIVDFLIPDRRLVIEVDGGYHRDTVTYDKRRQNYLESLGLRFIRITNQEVLTTDCESLRQAILTYKLHDLRKLPLRLSYGKAKR
jgi:very-short-patch-repair endonuclease